MRGDTALGAIAIAMRVYQNPRENGMDSSWTARTLLQIRSPYFELETKREREREKKIAKQN